MLNPVKRNPALFANAVNLTRKMIGGKTSVRLGTKIIGLQVSKTSKPSEIVAASLALAHVYPKQYQKAVQQLTSKNLGAISATNVNNPTAGEINAFANLFTVGAQALNTLIPTVTSVVTGKPVAPTAPTYNQPVPQQQQQNFQVEDDKIFGLPPIVVYGGGAAMLAGALLLALPKKK